MKIEKILKNLEDRLDYYKQKESIEKSELNLLFLKGKIEALEEAVVIVKLESGEKI
jgi:hypothetical protein